MEYGGGVYHVMDCGNRLEAIDEDDQDREMFLHTLGQACKRTGWRVHSYVWLGNHHHLLLETPEPNLCAGMKWMQGTCTIRHNARHKLRGHLFQGRYKAIIVEGEQHPLQAGEDEPDHLGNDDMAERDFHPAFAATALPFSGGDEGLELRKTGIAGKWDPCKCGRMMSNSVNSQGALSGLDGIFCVRGTNAAIFRP